MTTTAETLTAAEARALADRLEAEERALTDRQRAASRAAQAQACREEFDRADAELKPAADAAHTRWLQISEDDEASIADLFDAWCALRRANAARAAAVATANATLTSLEPKRNEFSGQPEPYRYDVHDPTVNSSFLHALDYVAKARGDRAAGQSRARTLDTVTAAGTAAAAAISD